MSLMKNRLVARLIRVLSGGQTRPAKPRPRWAPFATMPFEEIPGGRAAALLRLAREKRELTGSTPRRGRYYTAHRHRLAFSVGWGEERTPTSAGSYRCCWVSLALNPTYEKHNLWRF
jgi:hypothetical protein